MEHYTFHHIQVQLLCLPNNIFHHQKITIELKSVLNISHFDIYYKNEKVFPLIHLLYFNYLNLMKYFYLKE